MLFSDRLIREIYSRGEQMAEQDQGTEFGENMAFYSDRHPSPALRTALNAQYVTSRDGKPTIAIEIAPLTRANTPPEWDKKITLQLTQAELTGFCQVLFGLKPEVKGAYHGDNRNKGVAAYDNGPGGVGITVSQQGTQLQHQLNPDSRIELSVFVLRRLSEAWKVAPADAVALLRQFALLGRQSRQQNNSR